MREVPGSIPGTAPFFCFFFARCIFFFGAARRRARAARKGQFRSFVIFLLSLPVHFHGLVVRIPACHAGGPGSIPGGSEFASSEQFFFAGRNENFHVCPAFAGQKAPKKVKMRPRSWKLTLSGQKDPAERVQRSDDNISQGCQRLVCRQTKVTFFPTLGCGFSKEKSVFFAKKKAKKPPLKSPSKKSTLCGDRTRDH